MDSQKAANWSQIIGTILGAIVLAFAVWDHLPAASQSGDIGWGGTMKGYVPPATIALILLVSAILQFIASRRRHPLQQTASDSNTSKPIIEILSPFDHDEVGLYETVRGHVFPPDQELQVAVFAGDQKWYPQKPVRVKGSTWSAKCQFGNLEHPSGGSYKVVALLGNELTGKMYRELPTNIPKSNSITVYRPEATTEHELKTARVERDKYKGQLEKATHAFTDMDEQVEALTAEKTKLERELVATKKDQHALEQSLETNQRELSEARTNAQAQEETYKLECKTILIGKNMLEEDLKEAQKALKEETKRANYESSQREEFIKLYNESKHTLAAWQSVITHATGQAAQIDEWVRMKEAIPGKLLLAKSPRMVTLEIRIRNESLYPISIRSKDIRGRLRFKAIPLKEEIETPPDEPSIQDLEPRGIALIKLQQPLRVFEAERIQESREGADNDGLFWLGDLYIPISAKNTPVPVRALPLVIIPEHISLDVNRFSYSK